MIQRNILEVYLSVAMENSRSVCLTPFVAFSFLVMSSLLSVPNAAAEPKVLEWSDLVPRETADLRIPYGERVRQDLNTQKIRIPGYIVPVEFDEQYVITRFLIVPYFGACIHEPPPPPNQTIYAELEKGIQLDSLWSPFWIEGMIMATKVEENMATAYYSLTANKIEPF